MINLDKLKLVIFDFDDTLAVHTVHRLVDDRKDFHTAVIAGNLDAFSNALTNKALLNFINLCSSRGIRMGLMSATESFCHMQLKHKWVLLNYGVDLENFCVGSFDLKAKTLPYIAAANGLRNENILLVDDVVGTLESAGSLDFQVATPIEVATFMENL